jgi:nitrogen fixation NifU-like protein
MLFSGALKLADPAFDELYRELILDHFRHPHHHDVVEAADVSVKGLNPLCGDELALQMKVNGGCIERVGVQTRGCSISTASASMMADAVIGKPVGEANNIVASMKRMMSGEEPAEELGDAEALAGVRKFPTRVKCALLPWTTLEDAISSLTPGLC